MYNLKSGLTYFKNCVHYCRTSKTPQTYVLMLHQKIPGSHCSNQTVTVKSQLKPQNHPAVFWDYKLGPKLGHSVSSSNFLQLSFKEIQMIIPPRKKILGCQISTLSILLLMTVKVISKKNKFFFIIFIFTIAFYKRNVICPFFFKICFLFCLDWSY